MEILEDFDSPVGCHVLFIHPRESINETKNNDKKKIEVTEDGLGVKWEENEKKMWGKKQNNRQTEEKKSARS